MIRQLIKFVVLLAPLSAQAGNCIENFSEYQSKKSELPAYFQELPALFTTDSFIATAGLKIVAAGDKLKLEASVREPFKSYTDEGYIQRFCFEQDMVKVTLQNGKTYEVKLRENDVLIKGCAFMRSSAAKYAKVLRKIETTKSSNSQLHSEMGTQ